MKWLAVLFLSFGARADVLPDFSSETVLGELWYKQALYFRPAKNGELTWSGLMYYGPAKKCFELEQKEMTDKVKFRELHCEAAFEAKAVEPYAKIADFNKFKTAMLSCLDKADTKCLRGMISKTLTISFGVDGYEDRRDMIFRDWRKEDYARMASLIRKGVYTDGEYRKFPPKAGMGMRGSFQKVDGGWLLESYLEGD